MPAQNKARVLPTLRGKRVSTCLAAAVVGGYLAGTACSLVSVHREF